jgi:hypothetical protein
MYPKETVRHDHACPAQQIRVVCDTLPNRDRSAFRERRYFDECGACVKKPARSRDSNKSKGDNPAAQC